MFCHTRRRFPLTLNPGHCWRLLLATAMLAGCVHAQSSKNHTSVSVTPVSGESWLTHIGRDFNETSMGKTNHLGPGPGEQTAAPLDPASAIGIEPANKTGSDLYRFNCQGCHGETGEGAPPEINSVIAPVRATSSQLIIQRMRKAGLEMSGSDAAEMARQANDALLQRLHKGGENMPAFSHLEQPEIQAILGHLRKLANIPGAERESFVVESPFRVGEHIVKSTCHICHMATGDNPTPQQMMQGAIPPLSALPARVSEREFIRKVTQGAPVLLGEVPALYRGRMPVLDYLTQEEAADVYLYLTFYPPTKRADTAVAAASIGVPDSNNDGGGSAPAVDPTSLQPTEHADMSSTAMSGMLFGIFIAGIAVFVFGLVAGGLGFTLKEFRRLSSSAAEPVDPTLYSSPNKHKKPSSVTLATLVPATENINRRISS
jgi:mono/diheme cytochrome c family protein